VALGQSTAAAAAAVAASFGPSADVCVFWFLEEVCQLGGLFTYSSRDANIATAGAAASAAAASGAGAAAGAGSCFVGVVHGFKESFLLNKIKEKNTK